MTERVKELIEMLTILKENSYKLNSMIARDFTIVKDCKKESFDFVIDKVIEYIHNPLNLLYYDTDSVKEPAPKKLHWRIYINYALSGVYKYNFEGDKKELMTLIGVIHSTSLEQCRVDYQEVKDFDLTLSSISYVITPGDNRVYYK